MNDIEEYLMMEKLREEGLSITGIAHRAGRDRKTVRKCLNTDIGGGGMPGSRVVGSKLDS